MVKAAKASFVPPWKCQVPINVLNTPAEMSCGSLFRCLLPPLTSTVRVTPVHLLHLWPASSLPHSCDTH